VSGPFDWEQTDKAMAAELAAAGLEPDVPELTPEDAAWWEREAWKENYAFAMEVVEHTVYRERARFCPVCECDCGPADYESPDPSVGIWMGFWGNSCLAHGEFTVWDDGTKERG
jgi:hypothetical protein